METPEATHTQTSPGPEAGSPAPTQTETPDHGQVPPGSTTSDDHSFAEESFNPNELPDELQPVYRQMQAAYTQKTQSLASQRKEAEAAMAFMQALQDEQERADALRQLADFVGPDAYLTAAGFESGDEDSDEEFSDTPVTDPRLDEIVQWRDQLLEQQQEAELIGQIESYTEGEFARLGLEDDGLKELVLGRATVYDLDENGMPQIQQAWTDVQSLLESQQENWIKSKKTSRPPTNGSSATEDEFDFQDVDARQARMAARLEATQ